MKRPLHAAAMALALGLPGAVHAEEPFTFAPAGELTAGSGTGRADTTVYAPGIRFPIESAPAYANSQVWGNGGGEGEGSQCDAVNYSYPWHDNYCESRTYSMPLCPSGTGHQGQDIRAATCDKATHWVVAVADGKITNVGSYSVYLTTEEGTRFDYLHMSNLQIAEGDEVVRGQRLGKVSNVFGGTPTTVHLHFNVRQNIAGVGMVYVPPYASLVEAYGQLVGLPDGGIEDAGVPDAAVDPIDASLDVPDAADAAPLPPYRGIAPEEESGCTISVAAGRGAASLWVLAAMVGLVRRRARRAPR